MLRSLLLFLTFLLTLPIMAQNFAEDWQQIDRLRNEGKYRSALNQAESVYQKAGKAGQTDQQLKALFYRVAFVQQLEEYGTQLHLDLLRNELEANQGDEAFTAVTQFVLGRLLYSFAGQNSRQMSDRTADNELTADWEVPLAEWSLNALYRTGTEYLLAALENGRKSQLELSRLPAIVSPGSGLNDRLPTLYAALVHATLDELSTGYANLPEPVYAFRPGAELLLQPIAPFLRASVRTQDTEGLNYRTFKIFQALLEEQNNKKSRAALVFTNLKRLRWGFQLSGDTEAYNEALNSFYTEASRYPDAGSILIDRAELLTNNPTLETGGDEKLNRFNLVRAIELYETAMRLYPDTEASQIAENRVKDLKRPSLRVSTEDYLGVNRANLAGVNYRNLEKLYWRIDKVPFQKNIYAYQPEIPSPATLNSTRPLAAGSSDLLANDDYASHDTELLLPELPSGHYELLVSSDPGFDQKSGLISIKKLMVTNLGVLEADLENDGRALIVDRYTGAAVAGVEVELYLDYGRRGDELGQALNRVSDEQGYVKVPPSNDRYRNILIYLKKGSDVSVQTVNLNPGRNYDRSSRQTHFFLDRGLYRPGQTLYAKGIAVSYDEKNVPTLVPGADHQISLLDANGQNVATEQVVSDNFGAFDVAFVLPEGGLNGMYTITSGFGGAKRFRVEAYKRPRFEVEFMPYTDAVEAGDEVTVKGKATGFAGPAVSDGKVTYRVVRERRSYWSYYGGSEEPTAILATGITTTDEDGEFSITFTAETPSPNNQGPFWRSPYYVFKVYADVADLTGETHAASTTVNLRRKEAELSFSVPNLLDRNTATEQTISLNYTPSDKATEPLTANFSLEAIRNPDPAIITRPWATPDRPVIDRETFDRLFPEYAYAEAREKTSWPLLRSVPLESYSRKIALGQVDSLSLDLSGLPVGHYRAVITYPGGADGAERKVVEHFAVLDSESGELPSGIAPQLLGHQPSVLPGNTATLKLVTDSNLPLVLANWQSRNTNRLLERAEVKGVGSFTHLVNEGDRGGMIFRLVYVQHNRLVQMDRTIAVPWPTKMLQLEYTSFRDKLRPGEAESWTVAIRDHQGEPISAQLLAAMYDASLDAIAPFSWESETTFYPSYFYAANTLGSRNFGSGSSYGQTSRPDDRTESKRYELPAFDFGPLRFQNYGYPVAYMLSAESAAMDDGAAVRSMARTSAPPPPPPAPAGAVMNKEADEAAEPEAESLDIRTELGETAFFMPEIMVDRSGTATINFTTPEALTKWKLQLFAHTPDLETVYSTKEVVTQKELMILPNAPRFLREGDAMSLTAKVSNLSEKQLDGTATLELFDPETEELITDFKVAGVTTNGSEENFKLAPGKSEVVAWKLSVPAGSSGLIGYRVIARSGKFTDGEQNVLPVLTNRVFLTATKSFFLRPDQDKTFTLDPLLNSGSAAGNVESKGYTFEITNNPAWLAVKSLPYLTEYPYDCTEQIVNRFFANQLASSIVTKKPELQSIYNDWKNDPDALESPLATNQSLKQALLEETPWLREAADEKQQRERIAVLFDLARISKEQNSTLAKLEQRQRADGSFSWFPDGPENLYMTQYVVEGMQRLNTLSALDGDFAARAEAISQKTLSFLDAGWVKRYAELQRNNPKGIAKDYLPATSLVHYLYVRSYFLKDRPLAQSADVKKMWDFYYNQAKQEWTRYGLYEQALLANTFARTEPKMGKMIIESLRERALTSEEMGMYWKYEPGYGWQQLPIETHCRIFEAFLLNGGTQSELDEMRLYLLQEKRTNRWETTKATAAAVHALLLNGTEWTTDDRKAKVAIPGVSAATILAAERGAEAGTGYYQVAIPAEEVKPAMGKVTVANKKPTIAWGGMYWQFVQDIDAVEKHDENGPLGLTRKLFRRINTPAGERLEPITDQLNVEPGDRLVVQLTLRADRNFEYVHLKDRRAAGLEPTEQLSGYRYRGGLGFYFSPDDLAANFFIDYLPKGTHTLEYDLFVNHRGDFSNGLSVLQSMYAPEFSAYSEGSRLLVR